MKTFLLKILTAVIIGLITAFLIFGLGKLRFYFLPQNMGGKDAFYDIWIFGKALICGITAAVFTLLYLLVNQKMPLLILIILAAISFLFLDAGSIISILENADYFRDDIFKTIVDLVLTFAVFIILLLAVKFIKSKHFEETFNV